MSDLISRQAAIDALAEQMPTPYTPDGSHPADEQIFQAQEVYADCITTIKLLPPAQPEPHEGEWINTNPEYKNGFYNNSYYCSECHDYYTTSPYEMKFCPNCGAKMSISTK